MRGDRIIAVGTDAQIRRYVAATSRVIDLQGRLAIPGFIDSHAHFTGIGESRHEPRPDEGEQLGRNRGHGRGRGADRQARRMDPGQRLAPGKVGQEARAERRRPAVSRGAEQGVARQPRPSDSCERTFQPGQRQGHGSRRSRRENARLPAAAKSSGTNRETRSAPSGKPPKAWSAGPTPRTCRNRSPEEQVAERDRGDRLWPPRNAFQGDDELP